MASLAPTLPAPAPAAMFGVYVGATVWAGLWFRDDRVRVLFR